MSRRRRRNHAPAFKAKVALAAIKGDRTPLSWLSSLTFTPIRSLQDLSAARSDLAIEHHRKIQSSDRRLGNTLIAPTSSRILRATC